MSASTTPLERLLKRLDLIPEPGDAFVGHPGQGEGRLFGGLVAAQAVVAAGRTIEESQLHSLHGYFLRPGQHEPIHFRVERLRDGRSFTTRRVVAEQKGAAIFSLTASFARPEEGISHQQEMPEAPPPESVPDWEDHRAKILGDAGERRQDGPVEVRICDPDDAFGNPQEPRKRCWFRPRGELPDDPLIHTAVLVYASDRTLLSTAARPHGLPWGKRRAASLDHAVWIHYPPRLDGWVLYASESPAANAGRGLIHGAMYDTRGTRIASVAQEGLIRRPR
ncbi:MAG: acyl-CoA thioesterase II [Myxococcota bacterium]|nr:acyl-CoA thioesterase II [Myxococcota bacterium]